MIPPNAKGSIALSDGSIALEVMVTDCTCKQLEIFKNNNTIIAVVRWQKVTFACSNQLLKCGMVNTSACSNQLLKCGKVGESNFGLIKSTTKNEARWGRGEDGG